jgi:cyclin B
MTSLLASRSEAATSTKKTAAAAQPVPPQSPLPAIDSPSDMANPLAATEYVNDLYSYFRRVEPRFRVAPGYMSRQVRVVHVPVHNMVDLGSILKCELLPTQLSAGGH